MIAVLLLVGSIINSHYDSHENRNPGALIVIAGLGTAAGAAALNAAVRWLQGRQRRVGVLRGLMLTVTTLFLIAIHALLSLLSGPL